MEIPIDLTEIDETVIEIEIHSVDVNFEFKRKFSWFVSSYNETNCTIQIVWESPPWISSTQVRDRLTFKIIDLAKFIRPKRALASTDRDVVLLESGEWDIQVPQQAYPGEATENLVAAAETTGQTVKAWFVL